MAVQVINSNQEVEQYLAQQVPDTTRTPPPETPTEPAEPTTEALGREGEPVTDPDDVEGEDGFTPRQKRDLSAKMLKAIGKKHRELREAEEFAAAQYSERKLAEQRAAAMEQELAQLRANKPAAAEPAAADPEAGKPKREAFQTDEAYWDAVIDWRADKRAEKILKEERAAQAAERERQRLTDIETAARSRVTKAAELVPDYLDTVRAVDAEVPPDVAAYMQESEMFAELGYHLAKNPEVLAKLQKMHPREQLVTIGKIEATLKPFEAKGGSKETTTNGATPSEQGKTGQQRQAAASDTGTAPSRARDAAPVITPLNGSGAAPHRQDPRDMGIRETIADWSEQNRVNLRLRKRH